MKSIKKTIIFITLFLIFTTIVCGVYLTNFRQLVINREHSNIESVEEPPSMQLYNLIESAADTYDLPKHILYNVAYLETRYQGPFDWNYNPYLTSSAGAVGPMQIIPRYAPKFAGRPVTAKELKNNLKLNVEVSCKMLKSLYQTYRQWDLVLGFYNTGHPVVNSYASFGSTEIDYKKRWIKAE